MTRRKFVYDPETKEMVEVTPGRPVDVAAPAVWGNFTPVTMPGGEVLDDRGKFRRYLKQNDLVPHHEAQGVAERARRERAARERTQRHSAICDSYEHVRNQERARKRFG